MLTVTRQLLRRGAKLDLSGKREEIAIHPLVGVGEVDGLRIGGRKNVFDPFPGGAVGSSGATVVAITDLDCVIVSYPCDFGLPIEKTRATVRMLGHGTAKREVREILGSGSISSHIRCGETVNRPGGWSSWPPHHFDNKKLSSFEEVFYVFTDPKDGYGILRVNGELREVRSGGRVDIPLGEHPIVAGPDVRLMYFWAYVGADKIYPTTAEDLGTYK